MRTNKRLLTIFVVLAVLLTSFGIVAAQDPVVIHWWNLWTVPPELPALQDELIAEFEAAHPGVTVEVTTIENEAFKEKIATVMQAGDPPDLFQSWGGGVLGNFAQAGLLRDITPELTADDGAWQKTFSSQAALDLYSWDGKYYGLPWNIGIVGFWYNKDLFAQAGITETPKTWDELLTDIQKLKDAGIIPIALAGKDKWPGHFWYVYLATRVGGQAAFEAAFNRAGSFADPSFVQAFELLKQLNDAQPFQEDFMGAVYGQEAGLVGDGKAAMELMGQWAPGVQKGNAADGIGLGDKLGWFPFPGVEGGAGDPTDSLGGAGDGLAFGKNAPDATIDFAKFLTSADVQKRLIALGTGWVPTVTDAETAVTDPLLQAVMKGRNDAKYFQLYYDQYLPPAVANAVLDSVEEILAGSMTPEEAAQAIEDVAAMELTQ